MSEQNTKPSGVGLAVGSKIGKYEVKEKLGVGGQAIVYKCYDATLDRYVAVKQISSHLAEDPKFLQRFRKEAQTLAKLGAEQPAIVTIHELVEDERGLFIVMEFVPGSSLETILADTAGPIESKVALQIIWRLAAGLHAVHSAGIIHRDLKPGNIIIGEGLRAKITDFGVAASVSGQTSMVLGTTKYMAPELFAGGAADGRADMYSLGFIAYEMLAGRPKFNEIFADVVRDKHSEAMRWMKWHGNEQVKAPMLHEINPAVPVALSEIVAKMMAKSPRQRFESMEALGRAIKSSFSPRGRAAAAAAAAAVPAAPRHHRRGPAEKLAESAVGPIDEGDELEVPPEPPPTAPIPKKKMSLRTKLVLLGVIVLSAVAIGVIMGYRAHHQSDLEKQDVAKALGISDWRSVTPKTAFDKVVQDFDAGNYKAAVAGFNVIRKWYLGTDESAKAFVYLPFAQAHQAALDQDWPKAKAMEDEAGKAVRRVQSEKPQLVDWARDMSLRIDKFVRYRNSTETFRKKMTEAQERFAQDDFDGARDILLKLEGVSLDEAQDKERLAFLHEVDLKHFQSDYQRQVAAGDELKKAGKFDEAKAAYLKAQEMEPLKDPKNELLTTAQRASMQEALKGKLAALQAEQDYAGAMEASGKAEKAGDKKAQLAALTAAAKVKPSNELQTKITHLESDIACDDGLQLQAQQKFDEAKAQFELALQLDKDNAKAAGALEGVKKEIARAALVTAAQADFGAGKFEEAQKKYQQAAEIRPDEETDTKIKECKYQLLLGKVAQARAAKKYDDALNLLEQARQVKADAAAEIDALRGEIKGDQQYDANLAVGDEALKQQQWIKALDAYAKAKKVHDNKEVADRIATANYSNYLAQGNAALDLKDYPNALAYFKMAKNFKDTEEVNARINEAQKQVKPGP